MRRDTHDAHRDRGADGRERRGRRHDRADVAPRGGQAAFGEDHDQGRVAERPGQVRVVEVEAERVLAEHQAEAEVEQQRRQPAAHREPHGRDRDEQHDGADEQQQVELVRAHGPASTGWRAPDGVTTRRDPPVVRLGRYGGQELAVVQQGDHGRPAGTRASARS